MGRLLRQARRAVQKPPRVVFHRLVAEANVELERIRAPRRARGFDTASLLSETGAASVDELWAALAQRRYPAVTRRDEAAVLAEAFPDEPARVTAAAQLALLRRVDLLGSGETELGRPIDWLGDFKSGTRWPPGYARRLEYAQLDRPSDVKVPWELSRLQWVIPVAQAYLLTGDEPYAEGIRELLEEWIAQNPYAGSVNWSVTMEPALRLLTWTYLFHTFSQSRSWETPSFRDRFLRALWLHGDYTARNLERSDVNGNHLTANAAGLVFAGLFFARAGSSGAWEAAGWQILQAELQRQVTPDGVDFEASTAYHRLVTELFLLPALYRLAVGLEIDHAYRDRLGAMASFAAAYSRPDGTTPLWGDADDARALPLGGQRLGDHRYLPGLVALGLGDERCRALASGPRTEAAWLFGADDASALADRDAPESPSLAFRNGGVFVLRGTRDHVFVDCGPVGLAGRGGHGHNDCLSFEAVLDGVHLVTDCGSYVYTASAEWRNRFRGTAFHNTPEVDGEEQNRLGESLWMLRYDATPEVRAWHAGETCDLVRGAHHGYRRLAQPVTPIRTVALDRSSHRLAVHDAFDGTGDHLVRVPLHLAPGVRVVEEGAETLELDTQGRGAFVLAAAGAGWSRTLEEGWVSSSYGVREPITRVVFERRGPLAPLLVALAPGEARLTLLDWARGAVDLA